MLLVVAMLLPPKFWPSSWKKDRTLTPKEEEMAAIPATGEHIKRVLFGTGFYTHARYFVDAGLLDLAEVAGDAGERIMAYSTRESVRLNLAEFIIGLLENGNAKDDNAAFLAGARAAFRHLGDHPWMGHQPDVHTTLEKIIKAMQDHDVVMDMTDALVHECADPSPSGQRRNVLKTYISVHNGTPVDDTIDVGRLKPHTITMFMNAGILGVTTSKVYKMSYAPNGVFRDDLITKIIRSEMRNHHVISFLISYNKPLSWEHAAVASSRELLYLLDVIVTSRKYNAERVPFNTVAEVIKNYNNGVLHVPAHGERGWRTDDAHAGDGRERLLFEGRFLEQMANRVKNCVNCGRVPSEQPRDLFA